MSAALRNLSPRRRIALTLAACALVGVVGTLQGLLRSHAAAATTATARGAVASFDADLAGHRYVAACALLGPIPQGVLIAADRSAGASATCARALVSAAGAATLAHFRIPAANVAAAPITNQGSGVVLLQSDRPLPVTYTLTRQRDRAWLITGF